MKKERRAVILLMLVMAAIHVVAAFMRIQDQSKKRFSELKLIAASWVPDTTAVIHHYSDNQKKEIIHAAKYEEAFDRFRKAPFRFEPHKFSYHQWCSIGVNPKAAGNIQKYIKKGGRFRSTADIRKIHGMDIRQAAFIEKYLMLSQYAPVTTKFKKALMVDINTADSVAWESLPGVGPVLAGRIIRYRKRLGGFIQLEQLMEVYGFRDSLFVAVKKNLNLNMKMIDRIAVNDADFNVLSAHPYLGYKLARSITAYRRQHGVFKDSADLLKLHIMDQQQWQRLARYIQF